MTRFRVSVLNELLKVFLGIWDLGLVCALFVGVVRHAA